MSLIDFRFIQRLFNPTPIDVPIAHDDRVDTALEKLQGQINTGKIYGAYRLNGFLDRFESRMSFDDMTRVFTIEPNTPTHSFYTVYIDNTNRPKYAPESISIPDVTGLYHIYFNKFTSQLEVSSTFFDDIILENTYVSVIYWNAITKTHVYFADERHGIMDPHSHIHFHQSFGAQYISGLGLGGFTIGNGDLDSHAKFFVQGGEIRDEDLKIIISDDHPQNLNPVANLPVLYRTGTSIWNRTTPNEFPLLVNGGIPSYNYFDNGSWLTSNVPDNDYLLIHILATNDLEYPVFSILGNKYNTLADARQNALTEFSTLVGLPFTEFVLVATVIYQVRTSYNNAVNARIVQTADGFNYVDWRETNVLNNTSSNGTSALAGEFPLFIQDNQPSYADKYLWIQTNINGDPEKFTVFFNK